MVERFLTRGDRTVLIGRSQKGGLRFGPSSEVCSVPVIILRLDFVEGIYLYCAFTLVRCASVAHLETHHHQTHQQPNAKAPSKKHLPTPQMEANDLLQLPSSKATTPTFNIPSALRRQQSAR